MLRAVETLQSFAKDRNYAEFLADRMFQAAVEREFEILGEALNRLRHEDPTTSGRIPDWAKIIGFRNVLVHQYDDIEHTIVWDTLQTRLSPLRARIEALLKEPDEPES